MKLIIDKNRKVYSAGTWGTVNENDYEILDFEFPAELDGYNKRIVYYLGDERVWDTIVNNKAYITNAITTKGDVKAYVWCTKENTEREADTDFRTQLFEMNFYENENADGIVPTEVQVDGFNTMLTAMNNKITEIDTLETAIEGAEADRVLAEQGRVNAENTRVSNENTRQSNEQTRQTQEASREQRTNQAIAQITDMTEAYNQNAQQKTEAFNQNATNKTNDFNSNASSKKSDFNSNAESKTTTFNNNASSKTSDFNTNATNKTNAFDSNASSKTTTFNNNVTSKTTDFNTNAENKTTAFNSNATDKTTNFDNNASSKTTTFNENATNKTNDFNDNATAKTTAFNDNAQAKTEAFDEHTAEITADIEDLQQEVEELSENMPWNETEQGTYLDVTDAAKYSKNKIKVFGNTEQTQYSGKNLLKPGTTKTENGITFSVQEDGTIIANGTATANASINLGTKDGSPVDLPAGTYTISGCPSNGSSTTYRMGANLGGGNIFDYGNGVTTTLASDVTDKRIWCIIYSGVTVNNLVFKPMLEIGDAKTDYEPYVGGVPAPNPDYPQDIHVVSGNNSIGVQGRNLIPTQKNMWESGHYDTSGNKAAYATRMRIINLLKVKPNTTYRVSYTALIIREFSANQTFLRDIGIKTPGSTFTTDEDCYYLAISTDIVYADYNETSDKLALFLNIETDRTWVPYYHADYPINLGSIELCKIGDYQDYLYKENGNWYKYNATDKIILDGTYQNTSINTTSTNTSRMYFTNIQTTAAISINEKPQKSNMFIPAAINGIDVEGGYAGSNKTTVVRLNKTRAGTTKESFNSYLSEHNIVIYYPLLHPSSTQITDETLISQLEAIYNHLALVKGTNHITITPSDLEPYVTLNYMQDLPSKLDNLDSRLSLLE